MPFANNQDVKIYYEIAGQGPAILLAHGSTGNTTFWSGYGYVDQLKDQFTVISFDARGHGKSDKPWDVAAYDIQLTAGDAIAVLDAEKIKKAHFWGYSMGGYTGFNLAAHLPERLLSLIVGGGTAHSYHDQTEPTEMLKIFRRGVDEGNEAVVAGMTALAGSITPQYEARLRELDCQAMAAVFEYFQYFRPGLEDYLPGMHLPCLIYAGDADEGAYEYGQLAADLMPDARFVSLPGLNHISASVEVDQIMPAVSSFMADLDTDG